MKYIYATLLALTVALASGAAPAKKLSDMQEHETVLIEYACLNSFAVDINQHMRIGVVRLANGWRAQCAFSDPSTGKPSVVSLLLSLQQVEALDTSLTPKVYGENDVRLSGEHVIELDWSSGEHHRFRKTGDDDRFMRLVWGMVSDDSTHGRK